MMKNLHARSTPTRDHENEGLSEIIRQGQREAIEQSLSVGRDSVEPPHRRADGPSALECGGSTPLSISSHVVPASAGAPHPRPRTHASRLRCIAWFVILGIIFALGISNFAFGSQFSPRPPVERTSAFSLEPLAFLAELPAPSPSALGSWLISAVAALSILALGKQFMRKTPLEAEFLTRKEFGEFRTKVDADFDSLRTRMDHSFQSVSDKLDVINNRLHEVRSLVDRLDERTKHHNHEPKERA